MYVAALIVTVLVIVGLEVLILFIPHVGRMVVELSFTTTSETSIKSITESLKKIDIKVSSFKLCKMQSAQGEKVYRVDLELRVKRRDGHAKLIDMVSEYDNVYKLSNFDHYLYTLAPISCVLPFRVCRQKITFANK